MDYISKISKLVNNIIQVASVEGKKTGFMIGNTAKIDSNGLYLTPIRKTESFIVGGVVVFTQKQAIDIAKTVDGKIKYILVDAEKKIPDEFSLTGEPANIERAVREVIKNSTLWIYKGNDLTIDAIDAFLSQLKNSSLQGIGGTKITILGAGNIGVKLAIKLIERGALVKITRRNKEILDTVVKAINFIKPRYTTASIIGSTNNMEAAKDAEILIGATQGYPVITTDMINMLDKNAIVIDVGKGTLFPEAITLAAEKNIAIYRLDVSASVEGLIQTLWATENIFKKKMGRRKFRNESLVSGGIFGYKNEIVVDDISHPKQIYGIADGNGDFIRNVKKEQSVSLKILQKGFITEKNK
jgi:hypothetical protein